MNVVPASQRTQAEQGSSWVEAAGVGDKRQITVTVAGTLNGHLLPFEVLFEGKTERCHPCNIPDSFDIWHIPNHWAHRQVSDWSRTLALLQWGQGGPCPPPPPLLSYFSIASMSWFTFAIVSILCCGPLTCFLLATPLVKNITVPSVSTTSKKILV